MSPWIFPFFLLIPLLAVLLRMLHISFPVTNLLLANNLLFLAYLGGRLCILLRRATRPLRYDEDLIIPDKLLSLKEGAIEPWTKPSNKWWMRQMLSGASRSFGRGSAEKSRSPRRFVTATVEIVVSKHR